MENEEKEVFTAEEIKEQAYEEIIKDVIEEIDSREENLKVYYPYFVINKKLQDEKTEIDLKYKIDCITVKKEITEKSNIKI